MRKWQFLNRISLHFANVSLLSSSNPAKLVMLFAKRNAKALANSRGGVGYGSSPAWCVCYRPHLALKCHVTLENILHLRLIRRIHLSGTIPSHHIKGVAFLKNPLRACIKALRRTANRCQTCMFFLLHKMYNYQNRIHKMTPIPAH